MREAGTVIERFRASRRSTGGLWRELVQFYAERPRVGRDYEVYDGRVVRIRAAGVR